MLGDVEEHGPLLLMWAGVCQLNADMTGDSTLTSLARKFGHRSTQLQAFHYLSSQLSTEPFTGKTVGYNFYSVMICKCCVIYSISVSLSISLSVIIIIIIIIIIIEMWYSCIASKQLNSVTLVKH